VLPPLLNILSAPSPRRGEGWGEGFGSIERPEPPHPPALRAVDLFPMGRGEEGRREVQHHSENTKIIVALLPRLRSSGVVATRPMELRVSPVAIAMYCLPLTS